MEWMDLNMLIGFFKRRSEWVSSFLRHELIRVTVIDLLVANKIHNHHHQPNIPLENRVWVRKGDEKFIPILPLKKGLEECSQFTPTSKSPILRQI